MGLLLVTGYWVLSVISDRNGEEMRFIVTALQHGTCGEVGVCQREISVSAGTELFAVGVTRVAYVGVELVNKLVLMLSLSVLEVW